MKKIMMVIIIGGCIVHYSFSSHNHRQDMITPNVWCDAISSRDERIREWLDDHVAAMRRLNIFVTHLEPQKANLLDKKE